jgi:hypothetical protein
MLSRLSAPLVVQHTIMWNGVLVDQEEQVGRGQRVRRKWLHAPQTFQGKFQKSMLIAYWWLPIAFQAATTTADKVWRSSAVPGRLAVGFISCSRFMGPGQPGQHKPQTPGAPHCDCKAQDHAQSHPHICRVPMRLSAVVGSGFC